ncbi:DNA cytosine methyltransferase [Janthinobacterium sp. CAN_S7]|uniref:DNA cytosine methyltransferase n=1 Tax=Janthinobacterium sp. CAN_S7 TaxID=3071704 RepID=UPI00319E08E0
MIRTDISGVTASAHIPQIITKELGIVRQADRRKVRLSTNFLPLMGFEAGRRHSVEVLPNFEGIRLTFDANGPQQVYQRQYKTRRNNPFETVVEIGAQSILDAALPGYTERLHFTMRHGEILIRPLANRTFMIRRNLGAAANPFAAMVAMTSGIDVRCLRDTGFTIEAILEYRPQEARDKRDLTESGMLTVLANSAPRYAFNEDISTIDWRRVASVMEGAAQIAVAHISLQCDDFSTVKAASLKQRALEDLSTSADLVFDALRMIETINPAVVVLEQVPGFARSAAGDLFRTKLRKWGYHVTEQVFCADLYGGKTGRERMYLVASVFPDFEMPQQQGARTVPIWNDIAPFLHECRDVSHTRALIDGLQTGRARLITPMSMRAPTILKSQPRQAKDSIYIRAPDGRYLLPSLDLLRHLNGIPADFNFQSVSGEQCAEQIGQSIEFPLHEAICKAVHEHISANVGKHTVLSIARMADNPSMNIQTRVATIKPTASPQMVLFN